MALIKCTEFTNWLDKKLQDLNTDETVFGAYICGILEEDESVEEKCEALQGILTEIVETDNDIQKICNEILEKWQILRPKTPEPTQASSEELDQKLVKLLESQSLATTKQRKHTEEEKKIRDAILTQYGQMTDSEDEDSNEGPSASTESKDNNLEKNINAQLVAEAVKMKREQSRIESQRKKDKDKEDREKQKQLKEDKKEKRKTQKGERKR